MMLRSLYHVQKQHMIQFTVRQSYEHVDSLALIISCMLFHFLQYCIINLANIELLSYAV